LREIAVSVRLARSGTELTRYRRPRKGTGERDWGRLEAHDDASSGGFYRNGARIRGFDYFDVAGEPRNCDVDLVQSCSTAWRSAKVERSFFVHDYPKLWTALNCLVYTITRQYVRYC